jgi:hypothetical protein
VPKSGGTPSILLLFPLLIPPLEFYAQNRCADRRRLYHILFKNVDFKGFSDNSLINMPENTS